MGRERRNLLLAVAATLVVVVPLGWLWQDSRVPGTYSVMSMGYLDYGGGPHGDAMAGMPGMGGSSGAQQVSVADLVADPRRPADVTVDLTARRGRVRLADGRTLDGYTLNGTSPGPTIRVAQGQLLEVHLHNANVPDGITLHWHGVDVPNAEDGVAGVTQDAVLPGHDFTYRFVADHAGSYWYHSHQVSHEQVVGGLFGALVVTPPHPDRSVLDVVALSHLYDGLATLNGHDRDVAVPAAAGRLVRVRVVNTDNGPVRAWAGAPFRLAAVDGYDVHEPGLVVDRAVTVTAGGRADLLVKVPPEGVQVRVSGAPALLLGASGDAVPPAAEPGRELDLLDYGTPTALPFDPEAADRHVDYAIGRRPGFVKGLPGLWWTVNGHLFPHLPMFVVREGDVVQVRISNHSGDVHPMHLHGHHAVVVSRNGRPVRGSPWWFDSLNVKDGETFVVAFLADNPGVWMDHCHNLKHAAQGLVTHLMYEGVTEPYRVGGRIGNEPE